MGEIVQIQVGRCGNRVGNKFWETISDEHGLDEQGRFVGRSSDTQLDRINVYYEETSKQVYVPRAVFVGLDPTAMHSVMNHGGGNAFRPENVVLGRDCGSAGLWARGYYAADGVPGRVLDATRSEVEKCDRLQGFQVVHSLGGGTGSGLSARIVEDLRPAFPGRAVVTYSVAPHCGDGGGGGLLSTTAVESYNATVCAARLMDHADCSYVLDNRTLLRDAACGRAGPTATVTYSDINRTVSHTMSGVTAAMRFAGPPQPNAGLRKSITDLVPYAGLHFLVTRLDTQLHSGLKNRRNVPAHTVPELAARLLAAVASSSDGRAVVMAAAITFRHDERDPAAAAAVQTGRLVDNKAACAIPSRFRWSSDTVKAASYCCVRSSGGHQAGGAVVVANTSAVRDVFDRVCLRGCEFAAGPSVLHAYADHGVTADEFRVAREHVETLTDHYWRIQDRPDYDEFDCGDRLDDGLVDGGDDSDDEQLVLDDYHDDNNDDDTDRQSTKE